MPMGHSGEDPPREHPQEKQAIKKRGRNITGLVRIRGN